MATKVSSPRTSSSLVLDGLRRWARGAYAEEAAVELLARAFNGRFCDASCAWIEPCERSGWYWLNGDALLHDTAALSGGERRILAVVGALVTGSAVSDLPGLLAGMDRDGLALILAALAHAGGSHEHSQVHRDDDGHLVTSALPSLLDWPSRRNAADAQAVG